MSDRNLRLATFLVFLGIVTVVALQVGNILNKPGINSWESGINVWLLDNCGFLLDVSKISDRALGAIPWFIISVVLLIVPATRRFGFVFLLLMIAELVLVDVLLKNIVARPRPYQFLGLEPFVSLRDGSFLSGHTSLTFLFVGFLISKWRNIAIVIIPVGVFTAFTRMVICAHYLSDVICGAFFGFAVGFLFYSYFESYVLPEGARQVEISG